MYYTFPWTVWLYMAQQLTSARAVGWSDESYMRFKRTWMEFVHQLTPPAQLVVKKYLGGKHGDKLDPWPGKDWANDWAEATIPGLRSSILEVPDCGGVSYLGRGPGAMVDPAYLFTDNNFWSLSSLEVKRMMERPNASTVGGIGIEPLS